MELGRISDARNLGPCQPCVSGALVFRAHHRILLLLLSRRARQRVRMETPLLGKRGGIPPCAAQVGGLGDLHQRGNSRAVRGHNYL